MPITSHGVQRFGGATPVSRDNDISDGEDGAPEGAGDVMSTDRSRAQVVGNRIAAVLTALLALSVVVASWRYGLFPDGGPGPGLFPFLISLPLLLLTIPWFFVASRSATASSDLLETVVQVEGTDAVHPDPVDDFEGQPDRAGAIRVAATVGLTAAAVLVLERLGFALTMTAYVWGLLYVVARRGPWRSLAWTAVGVVVATYLLSTLGLPLPPAPFDVPLEGW